MIRRPAQLALFIALWGLLGIVLWRLAAVSGPGVAFLRPLVDAVRMGRSARAETDDVRGDEQLELHRLQIAEARLAEVENMLELRRSADWQVVAGTVVARDPIAWDASFLIDRGLSDGIQEGAVVFADGAVVGRIAAVARRTARVETIYSPECRIGVKLSETGGVGVLRGRIEGATVCLVDYLERDLRYRVGELVVTSGLSEIIPEGLPIGRVVPWDDGSPARIVNSSFAQLQVRAAGVRKDFRRVWVIRLR